jgi:pimeloyl-ACP methyl ester carboxylesterase
MTEMQVFFESSKKSAMTNQKIDSQGPAIASPRSDACVAPSPIVILVHGSAHSSFCWARVTPYLAEAGLTPIALDLPGTGLNMPVFPASAYERPFVAKAYAAEATSSKEIALEDYRKAVGDLIDRLVVAKQGPIFLVGHSLGGLTLNAVGESHAGKLTGLIYVAALMPGNNQSALEDLLPMLGAAGSLPVNGMAGAVATTPDTGVGRFDLTAPRSNDPDSTYQLNKAAYCHDVSDQDFEAWRNLLVPDDAFGPFMSKISLTQDSWGSLKRAYIKCTADRVVPVVAADAMIAAVDAFSPLHKTIVRSLAGASHSPFLSQPQALADNLSSIIAEFGY